MGAPKGHPKLQVEPTSRKSLFAPSIHRENSLTSATPFPAFGVTSSWQC